MTLSKTPASLTKPQTPSNGASNGHDSMAAIWAKRQLLVEKTIVIAPLFDHVSNSSREYSQAQEWHSSLKRIRQAWCEQPETVKNQMLHQMADHYAAIAKVSLDHRVYSVASESALLASELYDELGYLSYSIQCRALHGKAEHLLAQPKIELEF
ncbi:MAG: hypothetical protein KGH63_04250 [Candidatus Micrarchaeota archaeon]|nr:hypothetical protein [Candidatus Micrarchaeota archaeon]